MKVVFSCDFDSLNEGVFGSHRSALVTIAK